MSSPGMIRRVLFSEKGKRVVDIEEKSKIPINLDLSCCHMKNNAEMFSAIQKFVCAIYGPTRENANGIIFDLFYQKHQN